MAFIRIKNDSSTVLIDDEYVNLCVAEQGVFVLSGTTSVGARFGTISYTSNSPYPPMLALQFPYFHTVVAYTRLDNTHTWHVSAASAAGGRQGTYFIFDVPAARLPGTGLVVMRNAQGEATFDSDGRYMRVDGFFQNQMTDQPGSADLVPGRTYAVAHASAAFFNERRLAPSPPNPGNPSAPGPWFYIDDAEQFGYAISGAQLSWGRFPYHSGQFQLPRPGMGSSVRSSRAAAMVIDVTGY
ncbi:hypothetical protein [Stenotrophomonas sp. 24(2023)]|uniref:hypothetical protein n=1 Tax=Stenotrophomonas sp. 24(2023) TaxID=3068324 RepID=UPI0027E1F664|nr:hypothetical protein [Stenotrophomonas sp. 24(2023)]WMJ68734.1 hypothetical protein Q9R17_16310 [Stenotrophomonas sp. 24(2023)]